MTEKQCLVNFCDIFNDVNELMIVIDLDEIIIDINHTALNDLCYSKDEIIDNHISIVCKDNLLTHSINNNFSNFSTRLSTKYKKYIQAHGKVYECKFNNRNAYMLKFEKVEQNITKSMILEENFKNVNYGNIIKDVSGKYLSINDYFERLFSKTRDEVVGRYDNEVWDKEIAYRFRREDLYVISTKNSHTTNGSILVNDKLKYYQSFKSPILDKDKKVVGISCVIKDVSNNVELKNDLMVQNEQLSILYRMLNSGVSDDLSTMFSNLYDNISVLLNVDWLTVYLCKNDSNTLECFTSVGASDYYIENCLKNNLNQPFVNEIFESKKSIRMTRIDKLKTILPMNVMHREGIKHIAGYPIKYKEQVLGVITFACRSEEYTYKWDNNFVDILCKNIALLMKTICYIRD